MERESVTMTRPDDQQDDRFGVYGGLISANGGKGSSPIRLLLRPLVSSAATAALLDGSDTAIRVMIDDRAEYEAGIEDLYGIPF